jgi:hypothetical protein
VRAPLSYAFVLAAANDIGALRSVIEKLGPVFDGPGLPLLLSEVIATLLHNLGGDEVGPATRKPQYSGFRRLGLSSRSFWRERWWQRAVRPGCPPEAQKPPIRAVPLAERGRRRHPEGPAPPQPLQLSHRRDSSG